MNVATFVTGAFQENCYLVSDPAARVAAIVDPGDDGERLLQAIQQSGLRLEAIWLTHGHLDHIGGIAAIRRKLPVPIHIHEDEVPLYERGAQAASMYGIPFEPPPPPDAWFSDGEALSLGALNFEVIHAPGHAPGHVVIYGEGSLFAGDCLFAGSIGRTDLPLSDGAALARSLERIAKLPESTVVYPGHGPSTTIGDELRSNPFLSGLARPLRR